jgi:hypothetical protein
MRVENFRLKERRVWARWRTAFPAEGAEVAEERRLKES